VVSSRMKLIGTPMVDGLLFVVVGEGEGEGERCW